MKVTIYGQSVELVSRCVECDLAEPESLASLGGSTPGLVDGILSNQPELKHMPSMKLIAENMMALFVSSEMTFLMS